MAKLLYFGRLTDTLGTGAEMCALPENINTTATLRVWLDEKYVSQGVLLEQSIRIAINNELVAEPANISDTDEIAFMPPVGGG